MPRTGSNQVIDLTQDDEALSDLQYAMMLQEQEIANAQSIIADPGNHLFYALNASSSRSDIERSDRSRGRRSHRSFRYQPFPIIQAPEYFDDSYEALIDLSERIGSARPKGISQSQLQQLPSRMIVSEEGNCSICLSEYEIGDMVKGLPCTHWYHIDCIQKWLAESRFCPVCRLDIKTTLYPNE